MLSRLFSNLQIADYVGFHIENLQSAEYQSIFFHLKIAQS